MRDNRNRPAGNGAAPSSLDGDSTQSTPPMFDVAEGRRRRDEAVAVARAATHTGWRLVVDRVIEDLARSGRPFTAEDVRARSGDPLGSSPAAMGAAFSAAHRAGLIVPVGFDVAKRPEAHCRPIRVWQGVA